MFEHEMIDIPFSEIPEWTLVGQAEYTDSIYANGIRNPVLLATWEGVTSLVGGHRRILSLKAAHAKAEGDGSLAGKPWLEYLPAIIYKDVPPAVQKAWALADNEERSDNPLHAYLVIKSAQEAGDWTKVNELFKYNQARLHQVMEFEKLTPELLQAVVEGRMTKSNALAAAKLGARQHYVLELAEARAKEGNKPVVVTIGDIKAAKQARATAVLQTMSTQIVPKQAAKEVSKAMFVLLNEASILSLKQSGFLFEEFRTAFEAKNGTGDSKLYRLMEV